MRLALLVARSGTLAASSDLTPHLEEIHRLSKVKEAEVFEYRSSITAKLHFPQGKWHSFEMD
jgi:hypothetical protein